MTKDQIKLMKKMANMLDEHDEAINYLLEEDRRGKEGIKHLKKALGLGSKTAVQRVKEVPEDLLTEILTMPEMPIPGDGIQVTTIDAKMKVDFIITDIPKRELSALHAGIKQRLEEMCYAYGIRKLSLELTRSQKNG